VTDLLPHAHEVGLLLRQHHGAVLILEALEEDFDLVPRLQLLGFLELVDRDRALRLEAHVQDHMGLRHPQDLGGDDFALDDALERALVQCEHLLVLLRRVLLVVQVGTDLDGAWG
jgi:hypothetical protein